MSDIHLSEEIVSPELALVSPELRARAIAALPPIELGRLRPLPPRGQAQRSSGPRPLRGVVAGVAVTGLIGFLGCVAVVLALTEVANAIR